MVDTGDDRVIARFRMSGGYLLWVLVAPAIFVVSVFALAMTWDGLGPLLGVVLLVLAAYLVHTVYWYWLRVSYRVAVHEGVLRWWAPLRDGEVRLDRIRAIRPARFDFTVAVFEVVDGPDVLVRTRRGFAELARTVQELALLGDVRLSGYMRLVGRTPGSSGLG